MNLVQGETKRLVVEWTHTLVQFLHSYDDFTRLNSYSGQLELRLSLPSEIQTRHTLHTIHHLGDKKNWPAHLCLRKISMTIRWKRSNHAWIFVALLPIPPKYLFNGHQKTTPTKEEPILNWEVLTTIFEHTFHPLDLRFCNTGRFTLSHNQ